MSKTKAKKLSQNEKLASSATASVVSLAQSLLEMHLDGSIDLNQEFQLFQKLSYELNQLGLHSMAEVTPTIDSMAPTKSQMFQNFSDGLTSEHFEGVDETMALAMYAYEEHGDATRDNSFEDLVELGRDLMNEGAE